MVDQSEVQADKAKGSVKSTVGSVQQKAGELLGNDSQQVQPSPLAPPRTADHREF